MIAVAAPATSDQLTGGFATPSKPRCEPKTTSKPATTAINHPVFPFGILIFTSFPAHDLTNAARAGDSKHNFVILPNIPCSKKKEAPCEGALLGKIRHSICTSFSQEIRIYYDTNMGNNQYYRILQGQRESNPRQRFWRPLFYR